MQPVYLKWMLLLLGMAPGLACAQIYSYITESTGIPTSAKYKFVIDSWDREDTMPNPCFGQRMCAVGINHRHTPNEGGGTSDVDNPATIGSGPHPEIVKLKTMGELSRYYQSIYPLPQVGGTSHVGEARIQECVGLFYNIHSPSSVRSNDSRIMPGSICGVAPPPIGVCGIEEQRLDLQHGVLQESELAGNTARGSLRIVCSKKMNIVMHIRTGSHGRLDLGANSGIYSTLSVNGAVNDQGYPFNNVDPTGVILNITSTLGVTGTTVKAGDYSGQTVAILVIP
ncbi:Uncharacterised protein [Serratia proteamaculans]|nr:Uncharacterised protein [Serratia proteamaculans]CAI1096180.1 Uncharacterised protein [Serratia proteamaculans]CAI1131134.1 Uncharacterised protein [Serratia proteamaculans]